MIVAELEGSLYNPFRVRGVLAEHKPQRVPKGRDAYNLAGLNRQARAELALSDALAARGIGVSEVEWLGLCAYLQRERQSLTAFTRALDPRNWPEILRFCLKQLNEAV